MKGIAVFPGTFDPVTLGHHDIIMRAAGLFEVLYLAVGENSSKNNLLSSEERAEVLREIYSSHKSIKIESYKELTIKFCHHVGASHIIRGLRSATDFDYERNIAEMNHRMDRGIDTFFLISRPEYAAINASIVRDIWRNNGDISQFVHPRVVEVLAKKR